MNKCYQAMCLWLILEKTICSAAFPTLKLELLDPLDIRAQWLTYIYITPQTNSLPCSLLTIILFIQHSDYQLSPWNHLVFYVFLIVIIPTRFGFKYILKILQFDISFRQIIQFLNSSVIIFLYFRIIVPYMKIYKTMLRLKYWFFH